VSSGTPSTEKANSPALQVKLREVAGEYRDQALRLMALQLHSDYEERLSSRHLHRR
jgi:hypothetical protein